MCSLMLPPSLFVVKELFIIKGSFAIILMGSWERKETPYVSVSYLEPNTQTFWNQKDLGLQTETLVRSLSSSNLRFLI